MASRGAQGAEGGSSRTRRQLPPHEPRASRSSDINASKVMRQKCQIVTETLQPPGTWARGGTWLATKAKGQKLACHGRGAGFGPMATARPKQTGEITPQNWGVTGVPAT